MTVNVSVPRTSATRFVAFGDSITEGKPGTSRYYEGVSRFPTAYAQVLYNMLSARYSSQVIELYDEGYAGEQVQGGLPPGPGVIRLPGVLAADTPQVLLLQEGANDLNAYGAGGIPGLIAGLRQMIGQARGRGIIVFLGTLLPQRPNGTPPRGNSAELVAPANARIRDLAASENVILVDLYAAFGGSPDPWIDPDGLHPNAAGYRKMAETFFAAIQSNFEVAPSLTTLMRSPGRDIWTP
ncbi:MAG: SGNH/GDSL hydrolase family protein [Acidobacteriota bacterium]